MLPNVSVSTVFPALRTMNNSPRPVPNKQLRWNPAVRAADQHREGSLAASNLQSPIVVLRRNLALIGQEIHVALFQPGQRLDGSEARFFLRRPRG